MRSDRRACSASGYGVSAPICRDERVNLAHLVTRCMARWGLDEMTQARLLGYDTTHTGRVARHRKGSPIRNNVDALRRVSLLLAVHGGLKALFESDTVRMRVWLQSPCRMLNDQSPIQWATTSMLGLYDIANHLKDLIEEGDQGEQATQGRRARRRRNIQD